MPNWKLADWGGPCWELNDGGYMARVWDSEGHGFMFTVQHSGFHVGDNHTLDVDIKLTKHQSKKLCEAYIKGEIWMMRYKTAAGNTYEWCEPVEKVAAIINRESHDVNYWSQFLTEGWRSMAKQVQP